MLSKTERLGVAIAITVSALLIVFLSLLCIKVENMENELSKIVTEQQFK